MSMILKSFFDYIVSAILIILLTPLFLIIAIFIKIDSKGPVFFKQERVGKNGKLFTMYKFRTMVDNAVNMGLGLRLAKNDSRITLLGKFLRNWSLDELPQLINILKGEMSIIGPRPTLEDQVQHYNGFQKKRLLVKPGVTGWAQVNFGYASTIDETVLKLEFDLYYIKHRNLLTDFVILLRTPSTVLGLRGQ